MESTRVVHNTGSQMTGNSKLKWGRSSTLDLASLREELIRAEDILEWRHGYTPSIAQTPFAEVKS